MAAFPRLVDGAIGSRRWPSGARSRPRHSIVVSLVPIVFLYPFMAAKQTSQTTEQALPVYQWGVKIRFRARLPVTVRIGGIDVFIFKTSLLSFQFRFAAALGASLGESMSDWLHSTG